MARSQEGVRLVWLPVVLIVSLVAPTAVRAFTFDSPVSDACHERITEDAVRETGWPDATPAPALGGMDRVIVNDLPFVYAAEIRDRWSLAITIGVRFNDLHGAAATDLPRLAHVHNDPNGQDEHCLRAPRDDGPAGDASALDSCRSFILSQVERALGDATSMDLDSDERVDVRLAFRGTTPVPVAAFAFHIGRALHALQDAFTHTFRAPSDLRIRHVLNFVDWAVTDDATEARDGHPHISELDLCDGETEPRRRRVHAATDASIALLSAVFSPGTRAERLARAAQVLDTALATEAGCTADNAWCGAEEPSEIASCAAAPGRSRTSALGWLALAAVVLAVVRRRARRWVRPTVALVALAVLWPSSASAHPHPHHHASHHARCCHLRGYAAGGVGIDRGGFAMIAGARMTLASRWTAGLSLEWNPWFSLEAREVARGVASVYGSIVFTWLRHERVELRSTLNLGMSVLLLRLVGAPAGSFGPFIGSSLLGVAIRLSDAWHLVVEPDDVAFPIPKVTGVPYYYLQYRVLVGIEWRP
ncbi:MAG: hypothetical protein IT379_31085 [Deltaproteobacteria bacterium]|nr:hypothetical protein [Deltaproteobacteria bacterium]